MPPLWHLSLAVKVQAQVPEDEVQRAAELELDEGTFPAPSSKHLQVPPPSQPTEPPRSSPQIVAALLPMR